MGRGGEKKKTGKGGRLRDKPVKEKYKKRTDTEKSCKGSGKKKAAP